MNSRDVGPHQCVHQQRNEGVCIERLFDRLSIRNRGKERGERIKTQIEFVPTLTLCCKIGVEVVSIKSKCEKIRN